MGLGLRCLVSGDPFLLSGRQPPIQTTQLHRNRKEIKPPWPGSTQRGMYSFLFVEKKTYPELGGQNRF